MEADFHLPVALQREVAVAWRGMIVVAGGLDGAGNSVADVFSVDPPTGRTIHLGTMPQPFHDGAAAIVGSVLFVFGGGEATGSDVVQTFDLATRRSRVAGHLPLALSDLAAATVDGTVYLFGGFDDVRPQAGIFATTNGVRFDLVARLPRGLRYPAVAAQGSDLVVVGGVSPGGPVSTVYRFDPAMRKVSLLGHLRHPLGHATAVALGPNVYVFGGRDPAGAPLATSFAILPSGKIRSLAGLAAPLSDAAGADDGREAWLVGGWRGQAVTQVLEVTLATSE
jgi:hypothetical protein